MKGFLSKPVVMRLRDQKIGKHHSLYFQSILHTAYEHDIWSQIVQNYPRLLDRRAWESYSTIPDLDFFPV